MNATLESTQALRKKDIMPYESKAQMKYMHAVKPKIAKRWDEKYGIPADLPEKKNKYREGTLKK